MEDRIVPDEIVKYDRDYIGLIAIRNFYAKMPFGYRLAKKASIEAEEARRVFWMKLREFYPEFGNKTIEYNRDTKMVTYVEKGA